MSDFAVSTEFTAVRPDSTVAARLSKGRHLLGSNVIPARFTSTGEASTRQSERTKQIFMHRGNNTAQMLHVAHVMRACAFDVSAVICHFSCRFAWHVCTTYDLGLRGIV